MFGLDFGKFEVDCLHLGVVKSRDGEGVAQLGAKYDWVQRSFTDGSALRKISHFLTEIVMKL